MPVETFIIDACLMVGIAAFSVLFAELNGFMADLKVRLNRKRLKPFDCPMCLAWWIGLLTWYFTHGQGSWLYTPHSVLFGSVCSVLAIFISRQLRY